MPVAVIGAAAAAIGSYASGTVLFGLTVFQSALLAGASSLALSFIQTALAPRPKQPDFSSFAQKAAGMTLQNRSTVMARQVVYGQTRKSGLAWPVGTSGNNKYAHIVYVLAAHEVASIDEVWLNDDVIPNDYLDGSGNVIAGKYAGLVRIKKHLGAPGQTADADMLAEVPGWTSSHRADGQAYIYARLKFDRDVFPTGEPNISAVIRGKPVLDTRDNVTRWTTNIALMAHDNLTDATFGAGAESADVDADATSAAANACDEIVATADVNITVSSIDVSTNIFTLEGEVLQFQCGDQVLAMSTNLLPGGLADGVNYYVIPYQFGGMPRIRLAASLDDAMAGTAIDITDAGMGVITIRKIGEPRYHGGGVVDSGARLGDNLSDIMSGMAGYPVNTGGLWKIFAGVYNAPTLTFDEGHARAPITVQCCRGRSELFNTVKGTYTGPVNNWQPADYPAVKNATYKANDNGIDLISDLDLPFSPRPQTCMRLAKIRLERSRQEILVDYPAKMHAMQLLAGDTMNLNYTRMGWTGKPFEVRRWKLAVEDADSAPRLGVDMQLQETASAVYDWNFGEETTVDPAPNTNLPNPFLVEVVTGFSLDSEMVSTQGGDFTWKVTASWDLHVNQFVVSGGHYEIEFKRSSEGDELYKSAGKVDGSVTSMVVPQLQPDVTYDFRIYAFNNLGVRSAPTTIEGFIAGSTATTDTEDWENFTLARDGADWEADTLTSEDWN